jgi:hypothetical protein
MEVAPGVSRNSSGNYSLPSGNPVVGGTTISSTWANSTLGDLESAMTDSLSRSGKGGMQAPLKVSDGTVAAPGVTWDADPDCGLYRVGANSVGMSANSSQIQRWEATGTTITGTVAVSGAATLSSGATVTTGVSNGAGIVSTGNGTNAGVSAVGGATSGPGVSGNGGAPNGYGGSFVGVGIGYGVEGQGGTTGTGGIFRPGTAATATTRRTAITANNGDITFTGVVNPNSNVAISNTITAKNTPKAWAILTTTGGGSTAVTVTDGFNVSSASVSGATITMTLATAMASTNFAVNVTCGNPAIVGSGAAGTTTTVVIACKNLDGIVMPASTVAGTPVPVPLFDFQAGTTRTLYVFVFGAQ